MNTYEKGNKLLRLPVRFVDGRWEFYFGGAVPVKEGTFAELLVHPVRIHDAEFLERVTKSVSVCIALPGTTLLIALNDRVGGTNSRWLRKGNNNVANSVAVDERFLPFQAPTFVPVTLEKTESKVGGPPADSGQGGLWLRVIGTSETELVSGAIQLPDEFAAPAGKAKGPPTAISLNHAYTVLSERLETHRISHTGNVYTRVFYLESNGRWYPLEILRTKTIVQAELNILRGAWADLERQLGWKATPLSGARDPDRFKKGNLE